MVRFTADDKIYIKILYWGMAGSGKTTILDTFYRLTKEEHKDVSPMGDLTKISIDRVIFYFAFYQLHTIMSNVR